MKVLIIGWCHKKNLDGLIKICKYLQYTVDYIQDFNIGYNFIKYYDIIYLPSNPINEFLSNKVYIFGPHFSVFPDNNILNMINKNNKFIYIQPSKWALDTWLNIINDHCKTNNRFAVFPFPVDTIRFNEIEPLYSRTEVFVYYKQRDINDFKFIYNFLLENNIKYRLFNYTTRYNEEDYLDTLHKSKYGIIIGRHESQGFAIQEALSCNVPLLVWNVYSMNQEVGQNYTDIPATSIPYWDERCGEFFYNKIDFQNCFKKFIQNIDNYKPREYILEQLSLEKCAYNFKDLLCKYN